MKHIREAANKRFKSTDNEECRIIEVHGKEVTVEFKTKLSRGVSERHVLYVYDEENKWFNYVRTL